MYKEERLVTNPSFKYIFHIRFTRGQHPDMTRGNITFQDICTYMFSSLKVSFKDGSAELF